MKQVSIFKNFKEVVEETDITDVLNRIRQPKNVGFFENVRELYSQGKIDDYAKTKKKMTAFTVTGTFKDGRKPELMTSYSGLIILDFDKLGDTLPDVRKAIVGDGYTYACFLSPSGDGLKVIVKVDTKEEEHSNIFTDIGYYYGALTGVKIDTSGKDITRLCFMSYDPDVYVNEQSEPFLQLPEQIVGNDHIEAYKKCVELTNNKHVFEEGQRNVFVFQLACNCKRLGIPVEVTTPLIQADYGYDEGEVKASIKSAYQNNPEEYAKFANLTNSTAVSEQQTPQDEYANTPLIPDDVFEKLPALLKEGTDVFDDKRQRDVFLTGALSVIGGCFDKVSGIYHQHTTFPNLYAFIIAPAASGKGALRYSKALGQSLHANYISQGFVPLKVLFIPANSSASAVIRHISDSGGKGIVVETEADTLSNNLKQEWANFSDLLRKAFHHEAISISRTTNDQFAEVEQPRLSIALSGTPNQMSGLISSAEDGLFSRFIYYAFHSELEWRDARPNDKIDFEAHFKALSDKLMEAVQFLSKNPTKFGFTHEQWDRHTELFAVKQKELSQCVSIELDSTIKRMGNITYRIAMILTALRKAELAITDEALDCLDDDFNAALQMALTYLEHAATVYRKIPKAIKADQSKRKLYDTLPSGEFTRGKAVEVGKGLDIAEKTIDKYLKEFVVGKLLANDNYGKYRKA